MRPITLGSTFVRPFSLSDAPDSLPTVQVFAGETLLGSATVALTSGTTRRYTATYTLPRSGIAMGTIILMRVDWSISAEAQTTSDLFAGYVAPNEVVHVSDIPTAAENATAVRDELTPELEAQANDLVSRFELASDDNDVKAI